MLYHPVLMREIGERAALRQNLSASHTLQRNPTKVQGRQPSHLEHALGMQVLWPEDHVVLQLGSVDGWNGEAHEEGLHVYMQPGPEPGLLCHPCQRCGAKEPTFCR
jgi:hypothetical protein